MTAIPAVNVLASKKLDVVDSIDRGLELLQLLKMACAAIPDRDERGAIWIGIDRARTEFEAAKAMTEDLQT
jgi:hypothetical protein